ncbi:hypothetical protein CR66_01615 [Campylobacter mucosalis]|uniref:hypothetical protein n=1 Tax=Campylobacter mucosalis TaxID=202 RepID=UPI0004D3AE43|nr:hypothetical protein [Campylobacter mucosalis]KEA46561.1 hypothetical protein CR66_01615 [Campylobacter mucosalis]QKF62934.1 hypothetical protein CMCT_0795 [Campylobacter mucosalis]
MFKILMNFLPNLFKSNAIIYVLLCFCVGVSFILFSLNQTLNKQLKIANEKIGIYKLENELIRSSLTTCNTKIDEQNAKFKELEAKKPNLAKITANIKAKQSVKAPKNSECVEIKGYYERATQDLINKLKENRQ